MARGSDVSGALAGPIVRVTPAPSARARRALRAGSDCWATCSTRQTSPCCRWPRPSCRARPTIRPGACASRVDQAPHARRERPWTFLVVSGLGSTRRSDARRGPTATTPAPRPVVARRGHTACRARPRPCRAITLDCSWGACGASRDPTTPCCSASSRRWTRSGATTVPKAPSVAPTRRAQRGITAPTRRWRGRAPRARSAPSDHAVRGAAWLFRAARPAPRAPSRARS